MNLKQLIILFSLFLLMSSVSASEDIDYFNNTTQINFEGVDFNIPEGFGEFKNNEDYNDLGSQGKTCFYINEAKGKLIITVISDWMGMSLDELKQPGANKISINSHDGWNYTKDDLNYFAYLQDDKGVIIGVTNQTRLHQVIL